MYYFGTRLDSAGHFFYKLDDHFMGSGSLSFPKSDGTTITRWSEFPFDPESMPRRKPGESMEKGEVRFYRENGYTICAIEGSCKDKRSGSKSIFFTEENLLFWQLAIKILAIPIARKMIKQMPFEVRWGLTEQYMQEIKSLMAQDE